MSTHWILHCLYSLDPSSPDFSRRLRSLIWHDEREQFLTSLQGPQLARLVDFLDQVRALPSPFCLTTNWIPQSLSVISASDLSRQCLQKLQAICSYRAVLPSSYIASGQIARVGGGPIAPGTIADVWEGTYHGKKVSIKRLRAPLNDDQTLKKVRSRDGTSLSRPLMNTCGRCSHFSKRSSSGKG